LRANKRVKGVETRAQTQTTLTTTTPNTPTPNTADDTPNASQNAPDTLAEEATPTPKNDQIRAQDRVDFEVNWDQFSAFGRYQLRLRTKRNIGKSWISWIFKHGAEVEELQNNGTYEGRFWLCKHCHDNRTEQRPLDCSSTNSAVSHLRVTHLINSKGAISSVPTSAAITKFFTPQRSTRIPLYAKRF